MAGPSSIYSKCHGSLATSGSLTYVFANNGQISVSAGAASNDRMLELVLEADTKEFIVGEDDHVVTTAPEKLCAMGETLKNTGVSAENFKPNYVPAALVANAGEAVATQVARLCQAIKYRQDAQSVYVNFDISEKLLARLLS